MCKDEFEVGCHVLRVTSKAFGEGQFIPINYTCDGKNLNPPLDIGDIPARAVSLVIVCEDPDWPGGAWVHWLLWNIPAGRHIKEGEQKVYRVPTISASKVTMVPARQRAGHTVTFSGFMPSTSCSSFRMG